MKITQSQVQELFEYKDGVLYWKKSKGTAKAGQPAGSFTKGYLQTMISKRGYYNHRLIFLMHYGFVPEFIDHINNNRADNRIENLRECTRSENTMNSKKYATNTSGHKGVGWHKATQKWQVKLTIKGKETYFGVFEDLELAALVADEARDKYHKEFARCR